jgi:hypothetical protein
MQISGALTEADLDDARRYGILLLGVIVWVTVEALMGKTRPNWTGLGIVWLVIAAIVAWSFYRATKSSAKELAALKANRPDWISLEDSGVRMDGPNGATAFQPWSNFNGWREGTRALLLDMQGGGFILLSVAELPAMQRQSVQQFLDSHIMGRANAS